MGVPRPPEEKLHNFPLSQKLNGPSVRGWRVTRRIFLCRKSEKIIIIVKQDFMNMNKSSCSEDPLNEEEKENLTDQSEKSHRCFFSAYPKILLA